MVTGHFPAAFSPSTAPPPLSAEQGLRAALTGSPLNICGHPIKSLTAVEDRNAYYREKHASAPCCQLERGGGAPPMSRQPHYGVSDRLFGSAHAPAPAGNLLEIQQLAQLLAMTSTMVRERGWATRDLKALDAGVGSVAPSALGAKRRDRPGADLAPAGRPPAPPPQRLHCPSRHRAPCPQPPCARGMAR